MVEELIGMDFLSFTNSILFGQGISKMFANATDSEQKKILERMLQIDVFRDCQERAKEYLGNIESSRTDAKARIEIAKKQKATLVQQLGELQQKGAELAVKVREKIQQLEEEGQEYLTALENLETTDETVEQIADLQVSLETVQSEVDKYKEKEDLLTDLKGDSIAYTREIKKLNTTLEEAKVTLDNIISGQNVPKKCKMCGRELPLEDTTELQAHYRESITTTEQSIKANQTLLEENDVFIAKVEEVLKGKVTWEQEKTKILTKIIELKSYLNSILEKEKSLKKLLANVELQVRQQQALLEETYTELIENTTIVTGKQIGRAHV